MTVSDDPTGTGDTANSGSGLNKLITSNVTLCSCIHLLFFV